MELKVKILKWSAGLPVVMLKKKTADAIGVNTHERVALKTFGKNARELSTVVDTVQSNLVSSKEIGVSTELKQLLGLRENQRIDVDLSDTPVSVEYIKEKFAGKNFSKYKINEIIKDLVENNLSDSEIAFFISAMYQKGMNKKETINLIDAILLNGNKIDIKSKYVADKHCIGGVPGNRTTPLVVSICAAAGVYMPKSSSRAITSAAGTADVIEVLADIEFSLKELKQIIKKTKACMIWGGGLDLVPADSRIIKVEKTLKVDPEAQLLASVMSKKLAAGAEHILIDIPYGIGAKVDKQKALHLKKKFLELAEHFKKNMRVVLTNGTKPIGNGIGPVLELIDIIKILDPCGKGPKDLEEKSLFLAGEILEMTGKSKKGNGVDFAKKILDSGKAFEKFKEILIAQKGKFKKLTPSKINLEIKAPKTGTIIKINNKKINSLARNLGCPADKYSGVYLHFNQGETVKKGETLITLYAESKPRLEQGIKSYHKLKPIIIRNHN